MFPSLAELFVTFKVDGVSNVVQCTQETNMCQISLDLRQAGLCYKMPFCWLNSLIQHFISKSTHFAGNVSIEVLYDGVTAFQRSLQVLPGMVHSELLIEPK